MKKERGVGEARQGEVGTELLLCDDSRWGDGAGWDYSAGQLQVGALGVFVLSDVGTARPSSWGTSRDMGRFPQAVGGWGRWGCKSGGFPEMPTHDPIHADRGDACALVSENSIRKVGDR